MTDRLELNWSLDGFVSEQRYYCSETTIDPENLPAPKAVLAGDVRNYIDTSIAADKTYYVRVGSEKNGVEKLSEEFVVNTFVIKKIAITTTSISNASTLALKSTLEEFGYDVVVLSSATATLSEYMAADLIFTHLMGFTASQHDVIKSAFDAGKPVLCGSNSGQGGYGADIGRALKLTTSSASNENSTLNVIFTNNYADILTNAGVTVSSPSYPAAASSAYHWYVSSSNQAQGLIRLARASAYSVTTYIAVAEKNSLAIDSTQFPAKVALFPFYPTQWGASMKPVLREILKWFFKPST